MLHEQSTENCLRFPNENNIIGEYINIYDFLFDYTSEQTSTMKNEPANV